MAALARQLYRQACNPGRTMIAMRYSSAQSTDLAPQQVFGVSDPLAESTAPIDCTPPNLLRDRVVRITVPARNVMQSGAHKKQWVLTWDTQERWTNPLMGWGSTADPMSNLDLKFDNKEDAISFCNRKGWAFYVAEPNVKKTIRKNYGNNFSWDKRTRKNTK
eukprot:m.9150 g.9150  ORF g.9150 m.9150 type:complete len:162 (+) comp9372_c0_seq1:20-505(+)